MDDRSLRNQGASSFAPEMPTSEPLAFHRKLPGYAPTPLVDASAVADELGLAKLWVKDESQRLALPSFKILGASWAVYRALEERIGGFAQWSTLDDLVDDLRPDLPLTLAAATDGNHGRAVARMARLLGLEARIFVPSGTAAARIEAITDEGARCDVVEGTYDDAVARSAAEASANCLVISDTSWPGYEDVPRWVIEGYSTIFWEIDDQLAQHGEGALDLVVVQIGVGALAAAAVRHFRRSDTEGRPAMVGVEPARAACVLASMRAGEIVTIPGPHDSIMAGLNCGTPSIVAWPLVSRGFELYMAIDDDRAREGMRVLARAGVVSGETGAAGIGALIDLVDRSDGLHGLVARRQSARVLAISTEGATDPQAYEAIVGPAAPRSSSRSLPSSAP